ncbi:MAG: hypothetical protein KBA99_03095 [Bacteroidia bacterium]|nr:hypothetical protein [Bacteroidota bacterium]MBP7244274.1 hypothetical protein [Bacteroidia bacterium]
MSQNNINNFLDPLHAVEKVEAPAFLFSRIEQKIDFIRENTVSKKVAVVWVTSVSMIVLFNLFILTQSSWIPTEKNNLLQSLQIQNSNSLYP